MCASLYFHEGQIVHFFECLIIYLVSIIKDVLVFVKEIDTAQKTVDTHGQQMATISNS